MFAKGKYFARCFHLYYRLHVIFLQEDYYYPYFIGKEMESKNNLPRVPQIVSRKPWKGLQSHRPLFSPYPSTASGVASKACFSCLMHVRLHRTFAFTYRLDIGLALGDSRENLSMYSNPSDFTRQWLSPNSAAAPGSNGISRGWLSIALKHLH